MPLSEHEQRLLDQIERALYAEDPKFVSTVRGGRLRKPTRRRRLQGVAVFALGLVLLVWASPSGRCGSRTTSRYSASIGFLVMLAGAVMAVTSVGAKGQQAVGQARGAGQEPLHRAHGGAVPPAVRAGVTRSWLTENARRSS